MQGRNEENGIVLLEYIFFFSFELPISVIDKDQNARAARFSLVHLIHRVRVRLPTLRRPQQKVPFDDPSSGCHTSIVLMNRW